MAEVNQSTTLLCLFHHRDQAEAALRDLMKAGVPESSISVFGDGQDSAAASESALLDLGVPARDREHLAQGLKEGGVVVSVAAQSNHVSTVERIFGDHRATKIDETDAEVASAAPLAAASVAAASVATSDRVIPIVEEELAVGKRTVDQGGVRVYRRVIEVPVEESVTLREEHVHVERRAVDRGASELDLAMQGDRTIELTETAEEAVVGKSARVVEEVLVGKETHERVQHIHDSVRRTEVEVEEVSPERDTNRQR